MRAIVVVFAFVALALLAAPSHESVLPEEGGVNESSSDVHGQQMSPLRSPEYSSSGRSFARTSPPAGSTETCRSARRAVAFYIRTTRRWSRLAYQPRPRQRDRGRTCAQARRDVAAIRTESRKARLIYRLWLLTPKLAGETPWHTSRANPVNQNLYRLGSCETGGKPGQNGVPDWDHRNSIYVGALGFAWSTWNHYRHRVRPTPPSEGSHATPAEQLAVGRALVREFAGYSSWPSCHLRLGLPG